MAIKHNIGHSVNQSWPFSHRLSLPTIISHAEKLKTILGLEGNVKLIEGTARTGISIESRFRREWWRNGHEPLRLALQKCKTRIYKHARHTHNVPQLAETWKEAEKEIRSDRWRHHFLNLFNETDSTGQTYLRLFFRAAQQTWSRESRWHGVMSPAEPSPFLAMVELFAAGVWPIGCHGDSLWLFIWNEKSTGSTETGPIFAQSPQPAKPPANTKTPYIFLSSLFRHSTQTEQWKSFLNAQSWNSLHGPVEEEIQPPEVQLAKQIENAAAVIGLHHTIDPDFGLPWWMFQELDYARSCRKPVLLVCRDEPTYDSLDDLEGIQRIHCDLDENLKPANPHLLWKWLRENAG